MICFIFLAMSVFGAPVTFYASFWFHMFESAISTSVTVPQRMEAHTKLLMLAATFLLVSTSNTINIGSILFNTVTA